MKGESEDHVGVTWRSEIARGAPETTEGLRKRNKGGPKGRELARK